MDLVIQVEPPNEVETYIHRSGRTARAGKEGTCITFYDKRNQYMISQIERQAGIKFRIIGVPQPEEVIRASSKVMLKSLESVNKDVLPLFREAARTLVAQSDGDPEKALCRALAYLSGHYKQALQSRSLLTGQERQATLQMRSLGQKWPNPLKLAAELLHQYFPKNLADNVRGIKPRSDQTGVVFDFPSEQAERFLEIAAHLKETDSAIDFVIVKCQELPPLDTGDDARSDGAWRGGGSGFQKHGRHQSFGGADFQKNFEDSGWGGVSSSFKVKGSSSTYGSRQPSNQKQIKNGGPKSY